MHLMMHARSRGSSSIGGSEGQYLPSVAHPCPISDAVTASADAERLAVWAAKFLACDRMHYKNHKKAPPGKEKTYCELHCDPDKIRAFDGMKTEMAETTFSWLSRYKAMCRRISSYRFRFFLWAITRSHNRWVIMCTQHSLSSLAFVWCL